MIFWKEKYHQLELNLKKTPIEKRDVEIQCVTKSNDNEKEENRRLKHQTSELKEEIQRLNQRLTTMSTTNQVSFPLKPQRFSVFRLRSENQSF